MFWGRQIILFLAIVTVLYGTSEVFPVGSYSDTLRTWAAWEKSGLTTMYEPAKETYAGRGGIEGGSYTAKTGLYAAADD